MPLRETAPLGAPCWIDLMTSDKDASRAFYGQLFDWTSEDAGEDYGGYVNFSRDGVQVAGCMLKEPGSPIPDTWSVYLATADADATAEAVVAHGGQVMFPPMDVMDLGRMSMMIDSGGAAFGIWQPGLDNGFGIHAEPRSPSWFELHTRDYDGAVRFYTDIFGWDTHVAADEPDFRYTTLGEEADALAGVMDASGFLPEGVPAHWKVYFGSDDTDASMAKAVELGGTVVEEAVDTPYGRMGTVADPNGALFKIITP